MSPAWVADQVVGQGAQCQPCGASRETVQIERARHGHNAMVPDNDGLGITGLGRPPSSRRSAPQRGLGDQSGVVAELTGPVAGLLAGLVN